MFSSGSLGLWGQAMCLPCAGTAPGEQQEPINTSAGVWLCWGMCFAASPALGGFVCVPPQRIPSPLFVLEIWKACFVGLIECPEGTEELKWTAFTFLKVGPSPSTESPAHCCPFPAGLAPAEP